MGDDQRDGLRVFLDEEPDDLGTLELAQVAEGTVLRCVEQALDHLVGAAASPGLEHGASEVEAAGGAAFVPGQLHPELVDDGVQRRPGDAPEPGDLLGHGLDLDLVHERQDRRGALGADGHEERCRLLAVGQLAVSRHGPLSFPSSSRAARRRCLRAGAGRGR